jgi:nitronate monooxygenase
VYCGREPVSPPPPFPYPPARPEGPPPRWNLAEGQALEAAGVDLVVAQGAGACGHHAMLKAEAADPAIGTLLLTQLLVHILSIPVVVAGGLMDGRAIRAALQVGATAAMLGTAFLLCPEAGTAAPYREALRARQHAPTRTTRAFSGRLARGLENDFMATPDAVLPFPAQKSFTRDIRGACARAGSSDVPARARR